MAMTRAIVELAGVRHEGDAIGDDWSYEITVHGDRRTIPLASGRGRPNRSDPDIPPLRWEFRLPGRMAHELDLRITSTEHDIMFDDVGEAPPTSRLVADPEAEPTVQVASTDVSELLNGTHRVLFLFRVETEPA